MGCAPNKNILDNPKGGCDYSRGERKEDAVVWRSAPVRLEIQSSQLKERPRRNGHEGCYTIKKHELIRLSRPEVLDVEVGEVEGDRAESSW